MHSSLVLNDIHNSTDLHLAHCKKKKKNCLGERLFEIQSNRKCNGKPLIYFPKGYVDSNIKESIDRIHLERTSH